MDITGAGRVADLIVEPVRTLLGPAASEFGSLLGDQMRSWRDARRLDLAVRAAQRIKAKGLSPKAVDASILFPLLDAGSLAQDDSLKARWEAMLANAADPMSAAPVQQAFPAILAQLSPFEVQLLDLLYSHGVAAIHLERHVQGDRDAPAPDHVTVRFTAYDERGGTRVSMPNVSLTFPARMTWPLLENLVRLHLARPQEIRFGENYIPSNDHWNLEQTRLGDVFCAACRHASVEDF